MEAMAAAEQAIELATATTSMATAPKAVAATATAASSTATSTQPAVSVASGNKSPDPQSPQHTAARELEPISHQHGHMGPLQEALQLQRHSQAPLEEEGREADTQPLIAAPKGLLQVSLDQRPAKKYFDRSASFLLHVEPLTCNLSCQCHLMND